MRNSIGVAVAIGLMIAGVGGAAAQSPVEQAEDTQQKVLINRDEPPPAETWGGRHAGSARRTGSR